MLLEKQIHALEAALVGLRAQHEVIDEAAAMVVACLRRGGKLLICGNGGSAAEAQHFAGEIIGRYRSDRLPLPAVALSADGPVTSCIVNDFGWDSVFARQVAGLGRPDDLLVALSTSGNSPNILAALAQADRMGMQSLALLGKGGGQAKGLATVEIIVPSDSTATVQECHLLLIHTFCEHVELAFPAPLAK
jgi:D-sedoheptulose 7-phosphate isomerase